jgi:hypothetical protein
MRHIKPYDIFEGESPSDYTVIGIYGHSDKSAALDKLTELGMELAAHNLRGGRMWDSYFQGNKLVILRDPAGNPLNVILPEDLDKKIQYLERKRGYINRIMDSGNRVVTDPEEIRKITQALSDLNLIPTEEDIISHIKTNPMEHDLLDGHPRKAELIQRAGVKDLSNLARMMRSGII